MDNNTYANLLAGNKTNLSQALKDIYPQAPVVFKDRLMLDALGLPPMHTELEVLQKAFDDYLEMNAPKILSKE